MEDPQTLNRYSYVLNNPSRFTDVAGLFLFGDNVSPAERNLIKVAYKRAKDALNELDPKSDSYKRIKRALDTLGEPDKDNGVTVNVKDMNDANGKTRPSGNAHLTGQKARFDGVSITIRRALFSELTAESDVTKTIMHESSHAADIFDWKNSGAIIADAPRVYQSEFKAFSTEVDWAIADRSQTTISLSVGPPNKKEDVILYKYGWKEADRATINANIAKLISAPKNQGGYGINSTSTKTIIVRGNH